MGSPLESTNKFHTCSLRSVFAHVHAAVENDFNGFAAYAANSAKLFEILCLPPSEGRLFLISLKYKNLTEVKKLHNMKLLDFCFLCIYARNSQEQTGYFRLFE